MVEDGIVGVTSNPTIFQKAIADSDDYDEAIPGPRGTAASAEEVFFELAIEDVQEAADQIRRVYDDTGHLDGFVSFELPPGMANDTAASIAAAPGSGSGSTGPTCSSRSPARPRASRRSRSRSRPASTSTSRCCSRWSATTRCTGRSSAGWSAGSSGGLPIDDVHSVASFFVSRVDTAIDELLPEDSPLRGRAGGRQRQAGLPALPGDRRRAIAGRRWPPRGARVQRPLWASTGTKNPAYSDVLYVDS